MKKIVLASNLPRKAKSTHVVGANMQRFCNCRHEQQKRPQEPTVQKTA